jgi:hypothetical protein
VSFTASALGLGLLLGLEAGAEADVLAGGFELLLVPPPHAAANIVMVATAINRLARRDIGSSSVLTS